MSRPRLFSPFKTLKTHYRTLQDQVEQDLETKATGLPATGNWTKRLTQVILLGVTVGVGWSVLARVDVVVNASGKLEPQSQSQVVQARAGGVVTAVLVREGEAVKQGQLLMQFDRTSLLNRLQELLLQRQRLVKEIAVLRVGQQGKSLQAAAKNNLEISPELNQSSANTSAASGSTSRETPAVLHPISFDDITSINSNCAIVNPLVSYKSPHCKPK